MHPKEARLEARLGRLCSELDDHLEDMFGGEFPIHPNRPVRGRAANPANDGLFSTGVMFTLGYGSRYGRGFILDMEIRTLAPVPPQRRERIEKEGVAYLERRLPEAFPDRRLSIVRDGNVWKIVGDLSLGEV